MMHPYKHEMLHKSDHKERIGQAEHERLLMTLSYPTMNVHAMQALSGLVSQWWAKYWRNINEAQPSENTVVTS